MGNREDLLSGAKRCLLEKGYDRTTVRDITAAAGGVSMAAIGYHFGSREELLTAALVEALEEWGAKAHGAVLAGRSKGAIGRRGYESSWDQMIQTFTEQRRLWLASIQAFVQGEHSEEIRRRLAMGQQEGRRGMVAWLKGMDESEVPADLVRSLGSVQTALISGLMMQWLNDPASAPTGDEIARGLRELADCLESPNESKPKPRRRRGGSR